MSRWIALDSRRKTFAIAVAAVGIASVAYALILRNVYFGDQAVTAIDDIGEAVAAALAAGACGWAASRARGRDRLGWALMGISAGLWAAGEVVWSIDEVFLGIQPYPSLADAGFLASVPFAVAGIRSFWGAPRGTSAKWRVWFDGLIVAIALTSTAWGFGLHTVWESSSSTKVLDLAYPVSDILVGTILILAIRRATGDVQKGRMAFLLIGIACYSIADSAFAYLQAEGTFGAVGNVIDTGWFTGFLLIALAAIYPDAAPSAARQENELDLWQLALPWMTLLTAAAGDFYTALTGHDLDIVQSSMTGILAVLLTVNMIFERREFLEMLTELQTSRSTLNRDFKTALVGIQHLSERINEADRAYDEEVRTLAADIHSQAERLDRMVEAML